MKPATFLKITATTAALVVLPFISGVLIGKVSDSLLAKTHTANFASAVEVIPTPETELTPAPSQSEVVVNEPAGEPIAAAAITPEPAAKPAPTQVKTITKEITAAAPAVTTCAGNLTAKFICLLNNYRAEKGLGKVSLNASLSQVALSHSTWMNQTGIFSHTGLDGSRLTERCSAAGVQCLAENLADGILDADKLLLSWRANAGHNKNLLGPYTTVGMGVSGSYVTLLFN